MPFAVSLCAKLRILLHLSIFILYVSVYIHSAVVRRTWTTKPWCDSVKNPNWPFAYQKHPEQKLEWKGRTNSNKQDMRHECTVFGVESKCHRCENFLCGENKSSTCSYQIQGVDWELLPKNIPTISDIPWAVGGNFRYDYANSSRLCVFLSGGNCLSPFVNDYSKCVTRCWGTHANGPIENTFLHPDRGDLTLLQESNAEAVDIWNYPIISANFSVHDRVDRTPQGQVTTLAGSGRKGNNDGNFSTASFNNPQDVAIDSKGIVYVADTENHIIRRIETRNDYQKRVTTIAGTGQEGSTDGAALTEAEFSYPSGIAVYEDKDRKLILIYVADTGNHRIREIAIKEDFSEEGSVRCVAGLCGNGIETPRQKLNKARPHPGLADGSSVESRFDSPMGIAVDKNGIIFVADTGNNLIRMIEIDGTTKTIAGTVERSEANVPGCVSPCLRGVAGFRDGPLPHAKFNNLRDISIGPQNTLVVADGHRIRRVNYDGYTSNLESIQSSNRVVTLAGSYVAGSNDGPGDEATFNSPTGVTISGDGRIYAISPITCQVRRISTASQVAERINCRTTVLEVLLPSGCSSYNQPVDGLFTTASPTLNNIYYNYMQKNISSYTNGMTTSGRTIKDCTGHPPIDVFETGDLALRRRTSTGEAITEWKEDLEDGTVLKFNCPSNCNLHLTKNILFGNTMYTDSSSICLAAIHSGIVKNSEGGLIQIVLERGINFHNTSVKYGTLANGIQSLDMTSALDSARLFSVLAYPTFQVEVQTIAGQPAAQQQRGCGYKDNFPPLNAKFNKPHGIEISRSNQLSNIITAVIADTHNHRIRLLTATCSKVCENGGSCVGPDQCECLQGWSGADCSLPLCKLGLCADRTICVGPNECDCIPGYTGIDCTTPLCSQACFNGGYCSAPDTCTCAPGWFDSNCTTPVCNQTCGNGGNCTAPGECSCPSEWSGSDCRAPVCSQSCMNAGSCIAPNTCLCPQGWSGHDCSLPICIQGLFIPDPSGYKNARWRPFSFDNYVPCNYANWCQETNEFDCLHRLYDNRSLITNINYGELGRHITGRRLTPDLDPLTLAIRNMSSSWENCVLIEVGKNALTNFQYLRESNKSSGVYRYSPKVPYLWNATSLSMWRGILEGEFDYLPPYTLESDRQVALVEKRRIIQGVYACANNGNCIQPDVCECSRGWIGFDCRTPVCDQGYYVPNQEKFVASDPAEAVHPQHPVSNPPYIFNVETIFYDHMTSVNEIRGSVRYHPNQGGYSCSIRSVTKWEKPETIGPYGSSARTFNHPNYFSQYMEAIESADGYHYTHWKDMYWPPLYNLSSPLLDNTREGWKRGGIWYPLQGNRWQKGKCLVEFKRICSSISNFPQDLVTKLENVTVTDTDASYRPQAKYSSQVVERVSFWNSSLFGECVDHVIRGCFNNGTCIAPNTCMCSSGWSGPDCTIPICNQPCLNGGWCTLPSRCTCEKGWTGPQCTIPMCAQDCRNQGTCIAPDTCSCKQWPSAWRDGRENGGLALFRLPDGSPQLTGYTGYDCNTPICVQAPQFILNAKRSSSSVLSLVGHGKDGQAKCDTYRCPQYDLEVVSNDGYSFQSGCSKGNPVANPIGTIPSKVQLSLLRKNLDFLNTMRISDEFLCGNLLWEQGDYTNGRRNRTNYVNVTKLSDSEWVYGETTPGEGIYMCHNSGSCIAPDICSCGDGWSGIDCSIPLCRFLTKNGSVEQGCLNDSVCIDRDECRCVKYESTLHKYYPNTPTGLTGFTGLNCGLPICIQGVFDPFCNTSTVAGVEGCYRCYNGGECIAPDVCKCKPGWTGHDCREPICHITVNSSNLLSQLFTVDESKVIAFENDPCGTNGGRWGKEVVNGASIGQGNCTLPNLCTCLCRKPYNVAICKETGEQCDPPWQDPFNRAIPPGYIYGTGNCADGFQGIEDEFGRFTSCHLQIYVPSLYRKYTTSLISLLTIVSILFLIIWRHLRIRHQKNLILAKSARRKARRKSDDNILKFKSGAFAHPKLQ